mmetsp:Transcript_42421/g.73776  ORF Transcript_42421/g.73776 Transcript_42421/m.73776 type:complete len:699 (-) Transcript_42421:784-2880(-)|eukprot:CAMPEP_0184989036 /NCGR_PEP_ID=MMETSP1098-20130426/26506_1 /TAXON_ID=89044 /ORGANISM="Spumella elongata, Strain CCAP 955/1" /LENGTH=698 /DNA_ID=CAMNT_0027513919 /DNA_START=71 /DNA_END=2167 /DNA_ORIENTATION=+
MYLSPHDDGVETVAPCASFDINSPTFAGNNAAPAFKGDFMFDMVANCAHDLKTPLAAIFNSNQLAISILSDLQATLARESPSASAHLLSELELAKSTLETSLNMTEFMKMSINRCMDYTKVKNHSMKLSPKCGTINVAEALELPLKCMMSLDSDQVIEMKPLPPEMCSHIITDQQWLQENVLCLASNASKYSSHGTITLTVSLTSEHALLGTEGNGLRHTTSSHNSSGSTKVGNNFRHMSIDPNLSSIDNYEAHSTSTQSMNALLSRQGSLSLESKPMVMVEVEDTGIGLSEEGMRNLFAPFKQAQRLAGGTGLGLFSLANRMESLQGHCGVRGRRDGQQGCLFWFAFPYKPDEEAAEAALEQDLTAETLAQLSEKHRLASTPVTSSSPAPQMSRSGVYIPPLATKNMHFASTEVFPSQSPLTMLEKANYEEEISPRLAAWHSDAGDADTPQESSRTNGRTTSNNSEAPLSYRTRNDSQSASTISTSTTSHLMMNHIGIGDIVVPRATRTPPRLSAGGRPLSVPRSSCPPSPSLNSDHQGGTSTNDSYSVDYDLLAVDNTLHILLVDDTPSILKICSRTLMREGYRVSTAENGLEALKLLHSGITFDAVLMDLQMPVLDGLETVIRYRAEESLFDGKKRLFIVAVSANSDPEIAQGAIDAGFDGFIEKPFTIKSLQKVLPPDLGVDLLNRKSESSGGK